VVDGGKPELSWFQRRGEAYWKERSVIRREVTAAYRRVYDSRHLQPDCQEPGLAPEPYAQ